MTGETQNMLLNKLADKNEETRYLAAHEIGVDFTRQACLLGAGDEWTKLEKRLHTRISALLHSGSASEQLGGLKLMQELIPRESNDSASKAANFANYLRLPIDKSNDPAVLGAATGCLGLLAASEGGLAVVKPEHTRALKRLKEGSRLDSAVLVISQLAENAPTIAYVHIAEVFAHIWTAMRDERLQTREGASGGASKRAASSRTHELQTATADPPPPTPPHCTHTHTPTTRSSSIPSPGDVRTSSLPLSHREPRTTQWLRRSRALNAPLVLSRVR